VGLDVPPEGELVAERRDREVGERRRHQHLVVAIDPHAVGTPRHQVRTDVTRDDRQHRARVVPDVSHERREGVDARIHADQLDLASGRSDADTRPAVDRVGGDAAHVQPGREPLVDELVVAAVHATILPGGEAKCPRAVGAAGDVEPETAR
jgi:hypothetical protein